MHIGWPSFLVAFLLPLPNVEHIGHELFGLSYWPFRGLRSLLIGP